jgi:hypothetical protein
MPQKNSARLRYGAAFLILFTWFPLVASAQTPTVLAELFRNIDCTNCAQPDNSFESFVASHPGVIVINYNNGTPNPNDPFYIASNPASQDRNQFYGGANGLGDPTAYIDGLFGGTGSPTEPQWEAIANAGLSKPLNPIYPTVEFGPNGIDTISFTLGPHKLVRAYVAIIESKIFYDNGKHSYGNPPDTLWNNVFRTMLPGPNGSDPFSGITPPFNVVFDPSQYDGKFTGNEQNMTAVVFTEDEAATSNNSHQAEALGVVSLARPDGVTEANAATNRLIIPANPITRQGHIGIELQSSSEVQLTLFDLLGREVRTLVADRLPAGQTSVELEGSGLAAGCYVAHLAVDGRDAGHAMLVVQ